MSDKTIRTHRYNPIIKANAKNLNLSYRLARPVKLGKIEKVFLLHAR